MDQNILKSQYYQYFNDCLDVIKHFEKYRKKVLVKAILLSFLFFLCAMAIVYVLSIMILHSSYNPILFPILLFCLYACLLKAITTIILTDRQYQQKFNEEILPLILHPVANFKNWPKNQNTEEIIDTKLFQNFDTQEDVSCVFGYYKSSSITISDTKLTLPVRAASKPDIFKGIIIQIELQKNINNHIILISKNLKVNFKYPRLKININNFEEYLSAFAKNNSDNDFICEEFFEIMKKFALAYCAKSFGFSYRNNTIITSMEQRKAMPFGYLFKSVLNLKNYDEFIEKLIVIYDLVDFMTEN